MDLNTSDQNKDKISGLKLKSVFINNYRCFSNINLTFDRKLTVLVGDNGTGKTSLLDSIAILFDEIIKNQILNLDTTHQKNIFCVPNIVIDKDDISLKQENNNLIISYQFKYLEDDTNSDNAKNKNILNDNINNKIILSFSNNIKNTSKNLILQNNNSQAINHEIINKYQTLILSYYQANRSFEHIKDQKNNNLINSINTKNIVFYSTIK
jgi:predicted ATP-dependent endonuclease of OLD family